MSKAPFCWIEVQHCAKESLDSLFLLPLVLFWHQPLSGFPLAAPASSQHFFLPLLKDVQIRLISDSKLPRGVDASVQACLSLDIRPRMISWPLWAWHEINNHTHSCQIVNSFTAGEESVQSNCFFSLNDFYGYFSWRENVLCLWIVLILQLPPTLFRLRCAVSYNLHYISRRTLSYIVNSLATLSGRVSR